MTTEQILVAGSDLTPVAEKRTQRGERPRDHERKAKARAAPDRGRQWAVGLILPALLLASWDLATRLHLVRPVFLPSPRSVLDSFVELVTEQELLTDFRVSAIVVVQGFVLGGFLGTLGGIAAGLSKTAERFLGPTLNSIRQVPPLVWLPLIVLWVGTGGLAKGVIIAKGVFFPVFLNTLQGIRGVSKEYVEVARVFEYRKPLLLRKVILPAALPSIFVGLRYGAGVAWASVIAAEMLGGRLGLGFLLIHSQELLLIAQVFVVIVIIGAVGFLIDTALKKAEERFMSWKKGFDG